MTIASPRAERVSIRFVFNFIRRDLRGGLRGFGIFVACIVLGVAAIAGIGAVTASLEDGIAGASRAILGGDIAFTLVQREADAAEQTFLSRYGEMSTVATFPTMARRVSAADSHTGGAGEGAALVEVKAVDGNYPLFGAVTVKPARPLAEVLAKNGDDFGAAVDPVLLARLGLKVGDRIGIGHATIDVRAILENEPDRLAGRIGLGPRLLISKSALQASGLLQPGSLVRWQYRLRLPQAQSSDAGVAALEEQAKAQFPQAGWEIRTRANASPALQRNIARFGQFLTLIGVATLLIGGIGVANAVAAHLARQRDAIATMKALGATGGRLFAAYCGEIVLIALLASLLGAALGAAVPFLLASLFRAVIPFPVAPALHPYALAPAIGYGMLTALAFAIWPLGRARDISVAMLFRDRIAAARRWPRSRYVVASAILFALFATLAVLTADDRRLGIYVVAAAAAAFLILRLLALVTMWAARHVPPPRAVGVRLALANLHRPGALTPSIMLSLGLGLALLATVVEIDANLHREFAQALPERAPSFFFLDIPAADAARFDAFMRQEAPRATLERVPMLRGRIVAANGVPVEKLKPAAGSRWVLRGDRGITYAAAVPAGSRIVAGRWWGADYAGPPLVSLESRTAHDLDLKVGDNIAVNVLGRDISATIANLRAVDWDSLGINFVLVYSPGSFAGAPHTDIATLAFAGGGTAAEEAALLRKLNDAFPTITAVPVKEAIDAVAAIVGKLIAAVRGASAITLVAAALVLAGALAAGQRTRIYDAAILKSLGATRRWLMTVYALEYALLGLATGVFAVAAGSLAAALIVTRLMEFPFVFPAGAAAGAVAAALIVTVGLGLAGTAAALGRKPAEVLRNL